MLAMIALAFRITVHVEYVAVDDPDRCDVMNAPCTDVGAKWVAPGVWLYHYAR